MICRPPRILASRLFALDRCYACDARAIGTRDRRPEGGSIEMACTRHADTFEGTAAAL